MSRHFRLSTELRENHGQNTFTYQKSADIKPARGVFWTPILTIFNFKVDKISKYACFTFMIAITQKITKFAKFSISDRLYIIILAFYAPNDWVIVEKLKFLKGDDVVIIP